jgi:dynein heavy chain
MEKFNSYVAQVYVMMGLIKGRTMLPLPSIGKDKEKDGKDNAKDLTPDKDKAHVFEGSIITWQK